MLPRQARLRSAEDFAAVVRGGRRSGTPRVVIHLLRGWTDGEPRAGFVVSGKVGNSVVRHRVTRRLRPLVRAQLAGLPAGTAMVVRALPAAASATSRELDSDLRAGVARSLRPPRSPRPAGSPQLRTPRDVEVHRPASPAELSVTTVEVRTGSVRMPDALLSVEDEAEGTG